MIVFKDVAAKEVGTGGGLGPAHSAPKNTVDRQHQWLALICARMNAAQWNVASLQETMMSMKNF